MSFEFVWDATFESVPTNETYGYEIDDYIRRAQTAVRERMEIDHAWKDGTNDGEHKKITFNAQIAKPTAVANKFFLYTKDVSGKVELFAEDEDGNEIQMTSGGSIAGGTVASTLAQIDNIKIDGNTISSTAGTDINIIPLAGQQIVLDETIVVDAGVVTGATSITSTAFVGDLSGNVTGNVSGSSGSCTGNAATATSATTVSDAGISQSKLKTATGSVSVGTSELIYNTTYSGVVTLPGGEYAFYPQLSMTGTGSGSSGDSYWGVGGDSAMCDLANFSAATLLRLYFHVGSRVPGDKYLNATTRYVTSSGEVNWIFILRDKVTKEMKSIWQSPDHPSFGGDKNTQHPFPCYNSVTEEIVCITLSDEEACDLFGSCSEPISSFIARNLYIDDESTVDWPTKEVTVGLPDGYDWKMAKDGDVVKTIKKVIEKPDCVLIRKLKRK